MRKKPPTHKQAKRPTNDLRKQNEERMEALKSLNELRAPLWEALASELDRNDTRKFTSLAANVGKQMQTALQQFRAGKLSRARAINSYQRELADLRRNFEDKSIDSLWKHAKLQPSIPEVLLAWYGKSVSDQKLRIVTDKYLGWHLEYPFEPTDVGTVQQGLGGDPAPPPLGVCAMPPFAFHDDRTESQGLSAGNFAISSPGSGSVFVAVVGDLAGGASAHSLVGADFDIPAGFTNITITASISWTFSGWTFAVGGAAGTGADLALRVENPPGQNSVEGKSGLFSLISPVIWGNSASGSGDSDTQVSLATPDAAARTIRVFAGVSAHAEAFATFAAGCDAIVNGTVTKICISAT